MIRLPRVVTASILAVCGMAATASAQWIPNYRVYSIHRLGLYGPEQTGSTGFQFSSVVSQNATGQVAGTSRRYTDGFFLSGSNAWVWNGSATHQVGLTGPSHTGTGGYQFSQVGFLNNTGQVAGYSSRIAGQITNNGQDAWVWNGSETLQVGLVGPVYSGSEGLQFSEPQFQNQAGQVAGRSNRYTGLNTYNGQDTWVWNGAATIQVGLTGPNNTGSGGFRSSGVLFQNQAGQVAGRSNRYMGVNTYNGQDAWTWNGSGTQQVGLVGLGYSGSEGLQFSEVQFQNQAGQVAGRSNRYTGLNTYNGQDAWVWNGSGTEQIGLTGPDYTGSGGYRYSESRMQNEAGQVAGLSQRISGVKSLNGMDTWAWNGSGTEQIGLTGTGYTGSEGYRYSQPMLQNEAGQVTGLSARIVGVSTSNGVDAWVWNGSGTAQIGLTGPDYTGSEGYRYSDSWMQNEAGQVAGLSRRISGVSSLNGRDAWVWNGSGTEQIGLTGPGYLGSEGYQYSRPIHQNEAGQVTGLSERIVGVSTSNGVDAWVWNGTATQQAGLTGPGYTGSAGYQISEPTLQNEVGQVAGYSYRITGVDTYNGQSAWYFDPLTGISHEILGSVRTGDHYAYSTPTFFTEGGFLLGHYSFFEGGMEPAQDRAFIFRPDLGLTDLGNLVSGGLTDSGWNTLLIPVYAEAMNTLVGYGYVNGQTFGQSVFAMVIPAPGSVSMLGLAALLAARRRR